jgi:cysteinyl-tRNA synthetase
MTRDINLAKDTGKEKKAVALSAELRSLGEVLGILTIEPEQWFRLAKPGAMSGVAHATGSAHGALTGADAEGTGADAGALSDAEVDALVDARSAARQAKDFKESDRIRDLLAAAKVIVEDKPGGKATWRRA